MQTFPLDRTETRDNFPHFLEIPTRWADHDEYGHVNNAKYHTLMEMVIMHYLTVANELDLAAGGVQCFTAENLCRFHAPLKFPDVVEAGLRIGKLGNSSVRYEVGLFVKGRDEVAATGYFVDVFVEATSESARRIPDNVRACLEKLIP
ncbi:MAG TPA: thioesterase [Gammaproteobacteria bacterium]|jgi:acyl-CoA thioester hydrolase|nr:thioesterase [Gammaproteobacteria bacterium]